MRVRGMRKLPVYPREGESKLGAGMWHEEVTCIPAGRRKQAGRGYVAKGSYLYTRGKEKASWARVCGKRKLPVYPREGESKLGAGTWHEEVTCIPARRRKQAGRGYVA